MQWGGWSKDAKKRFKALRDKVKEARQRDHVADMEANMLGCIRAKHKIGVVQQVAAPAGVADAPVEEVDSDNKFLV